MAIYLPGELLGGWLVMNAGDVDVGGSANAAGESRPELWLLPGRPSELGLEGLNEPPLFAYCRWSSMVATDGEWSRPISFSCWTAEATIAVGVELVGAERSSAAVL